MFCFFQQCQSMLVLSNVIFFLFCVYRLVEVWKMLYHQTLLYQASLHRQAVQQGSHPADQTLQHEESWTSYLLAQIQAALQAAGQTLGKSRKLNSVAGLSCKFTVIPFKAYIKYIDCPCLGFHSYM